MFGNEDEHSGPFWEERQRSLERGVEESAPTVVDLPVPVPQPQHQFTTREEVLDFVRQHSI